MARVTQLTHNKQLQRTVTRHRGDAASAPFHYVLASRFTWQHAAAELRRLGAVLGGHLKAVDARGRRMREKAAGGSEPGRVR